jgi:diaminopimelate epimerase
MLTKNQFIRSHGLGNDYLVMDPAQLSFKLTPENIIRVCNRNTGIGSDGILALETSEDSLAKLRIFNPDGSEAEKSGNGLRIFCKFLFEHGYTDKTLFQIETAGGKVQAQLHLVLGKAVAVTVEMGKASFDADKIPVKNCVGEVVNFPLPLTIPPESGGLKIKTIEATCVTVGNPHCVVFFESLKEADEEIHRLGPLLEHYPAFPNRSNVQFVKVDNEKEITIRIWERGAGYTLASGSSSCAAASACVKTGRTGRYLTVHMPGGDLSIKVSENYDLTMRGPVEEICLGTVTGELLSFLESHSK